MELTQSAIHPQQKKQISAEQKEALHLPCVDDRLPVVKKMVGGGLPAFVLENVLSPKECAHLVGVAERIGYSFWDARDCARKDYRDADTIECMHTELADLLWKRMEPFIEQTVTMSEDSQYWQTDLRGSWYAKSINENLLFGRYKKDGHFAPHTDGCTTLDFNHRSMYTVIVYLNTPLSGGRTLMYQDDQLHNLNLIDGLYTGSNEYLIDSVHAKTGSVLLFYHSIVHEGERLGEGSEKYIIRTDVMYKREPPLCNKPEDVEAFQLYERAKELTNEGQPEEATRLFRRAFKLSPALAEIFQM
eukprot:TRINITY_DN163_c0_g1_i2.p1 TRINITY_DN163_c0_g1~~TRINITY_DN163_c0_g1_i2.p1  ORF type:complete len:302 (-),score=60.70 TRINITY_DN163_c0_g1_i2:55-960(-)